MSTAIEFTVSQYAHMASVGAFDQLDRKIELIRGEIREMSPAGPMHCDWIDYLARWSIESTSASDFTIRVQSDIVLSGHTQPVPDLVWARGGRYMNRLPNANDVCLIIEVADSSIRYDSGEKMELYAEANVLEYWVIDVRAKRLHRMTEPNGSRYCRSETFAPPSQPSPSCLRTARLNLADLFGKSDTESKPSG